MTKEFSGQKIFGEACNLVASDDIRAISLFKKAAAAGHPLAASNLGIAFYYGDGVEQSYKVAMEYFIKASDEDPTSANYYIGLMKLCGQAGPTDVDGALGHIETAAMHGMAEAQYELGKLYKIGRPPQIKIDFRRAIHWFAYAAKQGHQEANNEFGQLYYQGYETSGKPTGFWFEREQIEKINIPADEPFNVLVKQGEYLLGDPPTD